MADTTAEVVSQVHSILMQKAPCQIPMACSLPLGLAPEGANVLDVLPIDFSFPCGFPERGIGAGPVFASDAVLLDTLSHNAVTEARARRGSFIKDTL